MSGVPYIRFFGDDWLSGTQELSLEERGVLVTLVALTAATGKPPEANFDRLARRFGCTKSKAKKIIYALVEQGKLTIDNDEVSNARALIETENAQVFVKKQTEKANKKWEKPEGKPNENNDGADATAYATGYANQNQNQINPPTPQGGRRKFGVPDEVKTMLGVGR